MQITLQYLQLRKGLPQVVEEETVKVTLEELSKILYCTPRNVKIIIKKLKDLQWIEWESGRGRGIPSHITFLKDKEELLLEVAKDFVYKGELQEALEEIKLYGEGTLVREQFMDWFSSYLGYTSEKMEQEYVETLRFPIYRRICSLDPSQVFYAFDAHMVRQIFDTLVKYNRSNRTIEPHLAHHWEISEQGRVYTFFLCKGIHFHHGRELVADDVAYTLNRLKDPKNHAVQQALFSGIQDIHVINNKTIQVELKRPNYLFLRYFCSHGASIVPRDICEEKKQDFARYPIGTGPFKVVRSTESGCVLEAFTGYFHCRSHLDRVEIMILPDQKFEIKEPKWDELICYTGESVRRRFPKWEQIEEIYAGSSLITFNLNKKGPHQHLNFRRAIHHIVNRMKMIEVLNENRIYPSKGFLLQDRNQVMNDMYDPEQARKLLQEMNYQGEAIHIFTYDKHAPDAYWIKDRCEEIGISVEVTVVSWDEMMEPETIQKADSILYEVILDEEQVSQMELYQVEASFIRAHLGEEMTQTADKMIQVVQQTPSEEERQRILDQFENLLRESYGVVFLLHKQLNTSFHPSVRGVSVNSLGWVDFKNVFFQPKNLTHATRSLLPL